MEHEEGEAEKRRFITVTAPVPSSGRRAVMLGALGELGALGLLGLLGVLGLLRALGLLGVQGLCSGDFSKYEGSESITQQRPSCKFVLSVYVKWLRLGGSTHSVCIHTHTHSHTENESAGP